MRFRMRLDVDFLSEAELERVFQAALRVWRQVPFRIQGTDEFFDYLRRFGCELSGEMVRFPEPVIEKTLARIRENKARWLASNAERQPGGLPADYTLTSAPFTFTRITRNWPGSEITMYTHGQSLLACDMETNQLRPATEADLSQWCHVVDALDNVSRSHPTFIPTDVPSGSSDFHAFATIILNSRQPWRVSVYSVKMLPYFIEACAIAKGSLEAVKKDPVFATKMWVNSPFMITRENVEIAMEGRRRLGVPITPGVMPVAGAATPVTVAGALTQTTAECLGLCAISLAVDDRLTGISSGALVLDMRAASHRQSGPDVELHRMAAMQMNAYLFGGRFTMPGWNTSAQVVSPQALYEKALGTALGVAGGERSIGIGSLACSDVGSLVQLMLDYEMGLFFKHLFREVKVDEERIGEEVILNTAPRGAYYLDTDHTARFFREEMWLSQLMDFRNPLGWMKDPSDMIARAREKARQMVKTARNQCPLSEGQKAEIRRLVAAADKEAAGTGRRS